MMRPVTGCKQEDGVGSGLHVEIFFALVFRPQPE